VSMLRDISLGGYIPGDSILHLLDPRTKLLCFTILVVGNFSTGGYGSVLSNVIAAIIVAVLCGVGMKVWWWGLSRFAWMFAVVIAVNLSFGPEGVPVKVGGVELPLSQYGVEKTTVFTVHLAVAIVLSMALTFTTSPWDLTRGFSRLLAPLKRVRAQVEHVGLVVLLAMRFIPLLQQELRATVDAQKSRGVEFGSGPVSERARNLAAVLVPALMGALRRSDLLAAAMTSRGFRPGAQRSEFRPLHMSFRDFAALSIASTQAVCQIAFLG
jgi:energy-coupling factor transport system permease protein